MQAAQIQPPVAGVVYEDEAKCQRLEIGYSKK